MSEKEIEEFDQRVLFEDVTTGEQITKIDGAAGIDIPSVGETIALADVEFEDTNNLPDIFNKEDTEYIVQDVKRRFARATHTAQDPPTVFQFSVIRVLVEASERDADYSSS